MSVCGVVQVSNIHEAACGDDESHKLAGVGIVVSSDVEGFCIRKLLKNSPSELVSGSLLPGDRLLTIDGQDLRDKSLSEVSAMLTGPPNTKVTVEAQRDSKHNKYAVTLRRAGKEGDTRPMNELCKEAINAIQQMRTEALDIDQKDTEIRKLAAAVQESKAAVALHEANAQRMQEEMTKLKRQLSGAEQNMKDKDRDIADASKLCKEWQARAQEREQRVHALQSDKERLAAGLDTATCEVQNNLREIELQRSALATKADVEKKLQRSIIEAHEVRGELAKSRAQVAEGEVQIRHLQDEMRGFRDLQAEVADLKERLRVAHRRLTESEGEIMRMRPFETTVPVQEKKLQSQNLELSNTIKLYQECEQNLKDSVEREGEVQYQLKRLRETSSAIEKDLHNQLAALTTRVQELEKALTTRDEELQQVKLQLQKCVLDLGSAHEATKQGLDREMISDQKNAMIQRSVTEYENKVAELDARLRKMQSTIDEKLPALQQEVRQLDAVAKEKQENLLKALGAAETAAEGLKNEIDKHKKIETLLRESQQQEARLIQEIEGNKVEIKMMQISLQAKEAEIQAQQAELEAKCKTLASTTTQFDMSTIKCNGLEKDMADIRSKLQSSKQETDQVKSTLAVLQGKLTASESINMDLNNKINLLVQEKRVDKDKILSLEALLTQQQEELLAETRKLRKASDQLSAAGAHSADQLKQIQEHKSTENRLEMRIRVLEAEKGGISVEKGGLAEQLAKLDADFRALQQQLEDKRNELQRSTEHEAQLKALLDSLQVLPHLYLCCPESGFGSTKESSELSIS